ncbi:MAG: glycogen debranching protein GlgX [Candidatus Nitronauta litoralis]|uniref:Glycogen debranching protein GlgX n=1 Tax=Candidatus Nitronauta litoralis TaxID=2705533 RepID=A0A7T0FYR0_9BACT|nr:MAG: glycogen debranching protein GlgX [Candidatus Nitronauta litoralis]
MVLNTELSPGPQVEPGGIRFTVYSGSATGVDLCLFESSESKTEFERIPLSQAGDGWWSVLVSDVTTDTLYGYRVQGPYDPALGRFFNPNKILIDPYAHALGRAPVWDERLFGCNSRHITKPDIRDNADIAPLARVTDTSFDWEGDRAPRISWEQSLIYETHVKSLTARHPDVPESLRGSFLGLTSEPLLDHFKNLGVTTIELLPVHQAFDEWHCRKNGLVNYWGYNTLLPFAPDVRFARTSPTDPAREFKSMVKALHKAGIEVILDVVYNHTAEGSTHGPLLNYRGLDNEAYYWLDKANPSIYKDFTGCGNMWNINHPVAQKLVLDSLRFWAKEMHVDGFRFDLATVLGRSSSGFNSHHPFFETLQSDPVLSQVKLIAEPWDLGEGGYQLAHFPKQFSEWNDQYRNDIRKFWKGEKLHAGLFARRLSGSEDIFGPQHRPPRTSINYITCHDGFTLQDLVSYESKHNDANGEKNRDGNNNNLSKNYGEEGTTLKQDILEIRQRQKRNMAATLFLSLGTPMFLGGDELGKTQWGNNNSWCQDNEINYYEWRLDPAQESFLHFIKKLSYIRRTHPALCRNHYFSGETLDNEKDLTWLHPDGREIEDSDWSDGSLQTVGVKIRNEKKRESAALLLLVHSSENYGVDFKIAPATRKNRWNTLIDTFSPEKPQMASEIFHLQPLSLAILEEA